MGLVLLLSAAARRGGDKAPDLAIAASVAAAAPLLLADGPLLGSPVVLAVAALHLVAAALFVARRPVPAGGPGAAWIAALPSLVVGAWALRVAPPAGDWTEPAIAILAASAALAAGSLVFLGRSFAVFPAARPLVTSGPYALVRNPALAGEVGMVVACAAASRTALVPLAICIPSAALRVLAEERTMSAVPGWGAYTERTRWRLVPWVW